MGEDEDAGGDDGHRETEAPADDHAATDAEADAEETVNDDSPEERLEQLQERVAALQAERDELEAEREELEAELSEAEAEIEDLTERLQRKAADFENYKKRQERRREELEAAATDDLLERVLDVRDNLKRAVDQEADDVDSLREGVKLTLSELDKVLDAEDVSEIDPEPGTPVDPTRHEVMLRVESDQPVDRIAEVYQSGYERGEKVLRPAQVTVSDGQAEPDDAADTTDSDAESEPVGEQ